LTKESPTHTIAKMPKGVAMFTGPIGAKRRGKEDVGNSWPERLISGRDLLKKIQFATEQAKLKAAISNEINASNQPAEDFSETPERPEMAPQSLVTEESDSLTTISETR